MAELTLVVLAAGMGSRYGGPKQIEPIGPSGEWIIDYSVFDAIRAGFNRIVFVVGDDITEAFRARFNRSLTGRCRVDYAVQRLTDLPPGFTAPDRRVRPWGTGHAVWSCRSLIDGRFAVINADDFYGPETFRRLSAFSSREGSDEADHALIGYTLSRTLTKHGPVTRGVCRVNKRGFLLEVIERHRVAERDGVITSSEDGAGWIALRPDTTVSMNAWGFGEGFMAELSRRLPEFLATHADGLETVEFFLPDVVGRLIADEGARVLVLSTDESWFGVTFREDVRRAKDEITRRIAAGQYPARLWGA